MKNRTLSGEVCLKGQESVEAVIVGGVTTLYKSVTDWGAAAFIRKSSVNLVQNRIEKEAGVVKDEVHLEPFQGGMVGAGKNRVTDKILDHQIVAETILQPPQGVVVQILDQDSPPQLRDGMADRATFALTLMIVGAGSFQRGKSRIRFSSSNRWLLRRGIRRS